MKGYDKYVKGYYKYIKGYDKYMRGFDKFINAYLTIRPVARKGYGSITHEAKPNGLLTRGP